MWEVFSQWDNLTELRLMGMGGLLPHPLQNSITVQILVFFPVGMKGVKCIFLMGMKFQGVFLTADDFWLIFPVVSTGSMIHKS